MKPPVSEKNIAQLWLKMAKLFGHKWVSSYGTTDDGTWARGLSGITRDELAIGLTACLDWQKDWPPTLPQFRAMCITERKSLASNYQEQAALPAPDITPEQVEANRKKLLDLGKSIQHKKPGNPQPMHDADKRSFEVMRMLLRFKQDGMGLVARLRMVGLLQ